MGGYKYGDEHMLLRCVFFISMTQNGRILLNVLLMHVWIFEFNEIQVQISKAAVFESPEWKYAH